jgi:hypothetical protein
MIPVSTPLFLTMPIAWKGTLAQMPAGCTVSRRQARVIIYDYVDMSVPVLARMAAKRARITPYSSD